jgi:hypothetical protein
VQGCHAGVSHVVDRIASLLLPRGGDRERAFREPTTGNTVRAETPLAPEYGPAERPLGGVVGRLDPGYFSSPVRKVCVELDHLCQVPPSGESHHEISIAALARRLPLDEGPRGTLCRDQFVAAEAGGGDALESSPFDVAQVTPLLVNPRSLSSRQERAPCRVQGYARRWPGCRPVPTRDGRLGSVDRFL